MRVVAIQLAWQPCFTVLGRTDTLVCPARSCPTPSGQAGVPVLLRLGGQTDLLPAWRCYRSRAADLAAAFADGAGGTTLGDSMVPPRTKLGGGALASVVVA